MQEMYVIIQIKDEGKKVFRIKYETDDEYERKCFALLFTLSRKHYIATLGSVPFDYLKKIEPDCEVKDWDEFYN